MIKASMQRQYLALEMIDTQIPSDGESCQEGLGIFRKIADVFTRVLFNARAEITGMFKNFKRSELIVLHESRNLQIKHLLKNSTSISLNSVTVAIPTGMTATYPKAVEALGDLLATLNIGETITALEKYVASYETLSPGQYNSKTIETRGIAKAISRLEKSKLEKTLHGLFVKDGPPETIAANAFDAPSDIPKMDAKILAYDQVFKDALVYSSRIKDIEDRIGRIVDHLEREEKLDGTYLRELENMVRVAASQFDFYGAILHEMLRVEHNFALAMRKLIDYV